MKARNRFSPQLHVGLAADVSGGQGAKQSFKKECDINYIMGRYAKGQVVDHLAKHQGQFGFAPCMTFHEAMTAVRAAEEMFMDLDSAIRKRFNNDPGEFLAFAEARNDDGSLKNLDELRRLKLAPPAKPADPTPLETRVAELETDAAARVEIARRAIVTPPTGGSGGTQ